MCSANINFIRSETNACILLFTMIGTAHKLVITSWIYPLVYQRPDLGFPESVGVSP